MCQVTATKLERIGNTLTVSGTAVDCSTVTVTIVSAPASQPKDATVDSGGNWSVTFSDSDFLQGSVFEHQCGVDTKVDVDCKEDPSCLSDRASLPVECDVLCPEVTIENPRIDDCVNGKRNVHFQASVVGAQNPTIVEWDFGDGESSQATVLPSGTSTTHAFSADAVNPTTYTVSFRIVFPEGCEDTTINVEILPCEVNCPQSATFEVRDNSSRVVDPNNCLNAGDYTVIVTSPQDNNLSYSWSINSSSVGGSNQTNRLQTTLQSAQNQDIAVAITKDGCSPLAASINLVECGSPPPPPPPPPTQTFSICSVLRFLIVFGIGLAVLGIVLLLCPGFSTILGSAAPLVGSVLSGLGILIATIALVAWLLICKPGRCDWLLISWQVLFILGAVTIYAGFCPGCSWFSFGTVSLLAGLGTFATWSLTCRPTTCRIYIELMGFLVFILDVISLVEILLGNCVLTQNAIAAAIWSLALGLINAYVFFQLNRNQCLIDQ